MAKARIITPRPVTKAVIRPSGRSSQGIKWFPSANVSPTSASAATRVRRRPSK